MKHSVIVLLVAFLLMFSFSALQAQNEITFQVNMSVKMLEQVFKPTEGDTVVVRGSFNGWAGNAQFLTDDNGDSIYVGTYDVGGNAGDVIAYKFVIHKPDGTDLWEDNINNREFTLTGSPATLDVVYFDDDTEVNPPVVSGNILFQVETSVFKDLGLFDRVNGDSMQVRGGFNGWSAPVGNSRMDRVPGTETYFLNAIVEGSPGGTQYYKYFMDFDTTAHPDFEDWWGWEVPLTMGGGNREIIFEGTTDQVGPLELFQDVPPEGVIPAGTTVTVTFNVDMRPALQTSNPFDPATDSVFFVIQDPLWAVTQGRVPGTQMDLFYTDVDGDSIYTLTFDVTGPTYYGILYAVAYGTTDNIKMTEGGGFGFGRFRARYIQPTGANTFPSEYTFPTDTWTQDPPLDVETPPFPVGIEDEAPNPTYPTSFTLYQNYPNPFNPETNIVFSVSQNTHAKVEVFTILGQKVRTVFDGKVTVGTHTVKWDGRDDYGRAVASGIYFYKLSVDKQTQTRKMILMR